MKTGIWLDKKIAVIVSIHNQEVSLNTIKSDIEDFHIRGGSGTRLKGGPQDVIQDSKFLKREKHQIKKYFNDIVSEIKEANAIVLFGPAEMPQKFNKEITKYHKDLKAKIKNVIKTDSMTKRQVEAWVKDYFKTNAL